MDEGKFLTVCKLCGERALPLGAEPPERGWDGAPGPEFDDAPVSLPHSDDSDEAMATADQGTLYREPSPYAARDFAPDAGAALALKLTHHVVVPGAVIAMVASLLFYLVDLRSIFFPYGSALKWLGFWFTVAAVLIMRHAKTQGDRDGQGCYTAALGAATALVVLVAPWDRSGVHPGGRLLNVVILVIAWRYASSLTAALSTEGDPRRGRGKEMKLYGVERLRYEAWEKAQDATRRPRRPRPPAADAHGNPSRAVARLALPALLGIALSEPILLAGPPEVGTSALASVILFLFAVAMALAAGSALGTARHVRAVGGRVGESLLVRRLALSGGLMAVLLAVALAMPGIRFTGSGTISPEAATGGSSSTGASEAESGDGEQGDSKQTAKQPDERSRGERSPSREQGESDAADEQSSSKSMAASMVGALQGLGRWLRFPVILAAVLGALWVLWKVGPQLGFAQKSLFGRLAAFFRRFLDLLRGRLRRAPGTAQGRRLEHPWTDLGALAALPPRAAVLEAYRRFLLACEHHGRPRPADATPDVWLRDLPAALGALRPAARELTELYVDAAYAPPDVDADGRDTDLRNTVLRLLEQMRRESERLEQSEARRRAA